MSSRGVKHISIGLKAVFYGPSDAQDYKVQDQGTQYKRHICIRREKQIIQRTGSFSCYTTVMLRLKLDGLNTVRLQI